MKVEVSSILRKCCIIALLTVMTVALSFTDILYNDCGSSLIADKAYANDAQIEFNRTNDTNTDTRINYSDIDNIKTSIVAPANGILNFKRSETDTYSRSVDYEIHLYSDAECTKQIDELDWYGWQVTGGTTYYLLVKPDAQDNAWKDAGTFCISLYFAEAPASDIDLNSSNYEPNKLYAFGVGAPAYAKFVAPETAIYKISNTSVLCDNNKTPISVKSNGDGCGLIGGQTYYFKLGYLNYDNPSKYFTYSDSIGKITKLKYSTITADSLKQAKNLKAIALKVKGSKHPHVDFAFYLGNSKSTQWVKVKFTKSKQWIMTADRTNMKGNYKFYVYNSRGKTVAHSSSMRATYYGKNLKKGTYYIKVVKTSKMATGIANLYLY